MEDNHTCGSSGGSGSGSGSGTKANGGGRATGPGRGTTLLLSVECRPSRQSLPRIEHPRIARRCVLHGSCIICCAQTATGASRWATWMPRCPAWRCAAPKPAASTAAARTWRSACTPKWRPTTGACGGGRGRLGCVTLPELRPPQQKGCSAGCVVSRARASGKMPSPDTQLVFATPFPAQLPA